MEQNGKTFEEKRTNDDRKRNYVFLERKPDTFFLIVEMFTLANATRISLNTKQTHAEKEREGGDGGGKTKRAFRFGLSATFHVSTKYTYTHSALFI